MRRTTRNSPADHEGVSQLRAARFHDLAFGGQVAKPSGLRRHVVRTGLIPAEVGRDPIATTAGTEATSIPHRPGQGRLHRRDLHQALHFPSRYIGKCRYPYVRRWVSKGSNPATTAADFRMRTAGSRDRRADAGPRPRPRSNCRSDRPADQDHQLAQGRLRHRAASSPCLDTVPARCHRSSGTRNGPFRRSTTPLRPHSMAVRTPDPTSARKAETPPLNTTEFRNYEVPGFTTWPKWS